MVFPIFPEEEPGFRRRQRRVRRPVNQDLLSRLQAQARAVRGAKEAEEARAMLAEASRLDEASRSLRQQQEETLAQLSKRLREAKAGPQAAVARPTDVLSRTVSAPGIRHILGALGFVQERAIEPAAAFAFKGLVGAFTPGIELPIERRLATRAKGVKGLQETVEQFREAPLPSAKIRLPFDVTGFIPKGIKGERSLREVQVGVKGLTELGVGLPLDIAAGFGAGRVLRLAKAAIKAPAVTPAPVKGGVLEKAFGFRVTAKREAGVVYHGSGSDSITNFLTQPEDLAGNTGSASARLGAFFSENPDIARTAAYGFTPLGAFDPKRQLTLYSVRLKLKKPLNLDAVSPGQLEELDKAFPGFAAVYNATEDKFPVLGFLSRQRAAAPGVVNFRTYARTHGVDDAAIEQMWNSHSGLYPEWERITFTPSRTNAPRVLKGMGYDGIVVRTIEDSGEGLGPQRQFVVFDAKNITVIRKTPVWEPLPFEARSVPAFVEKAGVPLREKARDVQLRLREHLTQQFAGVDDLSRGLKRQWRKDFGSELPDELNPILQATVLQGAASAGLVRGQQALRRATEQLGEGIDVRYFKDYLRRRSQQDILAQHPERVLPANLGTRETLETGIREMRQTLGEDGFARVEAAAQEVWRHFDELLKDGVELFGEDIYQLLRSKYPHYIPTGYQRMLAEEITIPGKVLSNTATGLRRLSEEGVEDALADPMDLILRASAQQEVLISRNRAARSLVQALLRTDAGAQMQKVSLVRPVAKEGEKLIFRPVRGERRGTLSYLDHGTQQTWEGVPDWAVREAKLLPALKVNALERFFRGVNAIPRAFITTYNPAFFLANLAHDTMTAAWIQGVMPHETFVALVKNMRGIFREDKGMEQLIRAGGDVTGLVGRGPEDVMRSLERTGNIVLRTEPDFKRWLGRPWEFVSAVGHAAEMAPRRAVFEAELRRGKTAAQAALSARRVTVDFQQGGQAVRHASNYFLYLNASVQGALLPVRALKESWRARAGLGGFMLANAGAYAWNRQFPEYYDVPLFERLTKFIVMLPSTEIDRQGRKRPHSIAIVPMLREMSLAQSLGNYLYEKLDEKDPDAAAMFYGTVMGVVNPFETIGRLPVAGHPFKVLTEIALNQDTFRNREIVPPDLQGLPPEEQFDEDTSEVALRIGRVLGLSPKKVDYFMRSMGIARDLLLMGDATLRAEQGEDPEAEGVASLLTEMRETLSTEEFQRLRKTVLADLEPSLRKKVEEAERRPEPVVPFLSAIQRRFYRRQGGALYAQGLKLAAREAKLSVAQIKKMNRELGLVGDELFAMQKGLDFSFEEGEVDGRQWRDASKTQSALYRGALLSVGIELPREADLLLDPARRAQFYDRVNTVGGSIPDVRTRAQILVAGLRAVSIPEIAPGVEDWDTYFALREQYLARLPEADRALVKAETEAGMTRLEREFSRTRDKYRSYWEVHRRLLADDPVRVQQYREFRRLGGRLRDAALRENPWLGKIQSSESGIRERMRLIDPELDAFLFRWGYTTTLANRANAGREAEFAPWLAKRLPALAAAP